jgi:hypothetical protein
MQMTIFTILGLRLLGISGITGSILFIIGDLLYSHIPGSKDNPTVRMSKLPEARLLAAGTLGLIGCWFYTLASLHLYIAFRPAGDIFAFILSVAFAAIMVCFGISHTAYFAIAAGAQAAVRLGSGAESGGRLGKAFFQRLVTITYIPVVIANLMMLYGIVAGRSLYPRWAVVFLPIIIFLIKTPVIRLLKGHLQELVTDSYDNLIVFVFFVLSTLVLWNGIVS